MSGVWVFNNGVMRLVERPALGSHKRKVLVYAATGEVIQSFETLTLRMREVGWSRRPRGNPNLVQFEKERHLISLPSDFSDLILMHMYDIVVQTRNAFVVRELPSAASA